MKKLLLLAACCAALCTSCGSLGLSSVKMDTPEATTLVRETLEKNIDLNEWKIYSVMWMEGEKLENDLQTLSINLVNKSGSCFSQSFILQGTGKGTVSDLRKATGMPQVDFDKVTGILPASIDPAAIQKQYEEAKSAVPEGYTFKSINDYEISETMTSGNEFFDRGKNIGEIKTRFEINITEDGKEIIESAGKKSIQYYQVQFDVLPDGSIQMEE